jgi:hypothetical protein
MNQDLTFDETVRAPADRRLDWPLRTSPCPICGFYGQPPRVEHEGVPDPTRCVWCGAKTPATGWDETPPGAPRPTSRRARIARPSRRGWTDP